MFRYKNRFLVETVDVITPIVDDPYTFGAICAANSVSDVYAMGGTPLTALAILGFTSSDFSPAVIKEILKGAVDKLKEAGTCLIGGHSIEDNEFKLGFAVTGTVEKNSILKAGGAAAGQHGEIGAGFGQRPVEQQVMAACDDGRRRRARGRRRPLGVLRHPAVDQVAREQQLAGHPRARDAAVGGKLVDLALLDAEMVRKLPCGHQFGHGFSLGLALFRSAVFC